MRRSEWRSGSDTKLTLTWSSYTWTCWFSVLFSNPTFPISWVFVFRVRFRFWLRAVPLSLLCPAEFRRLPLPGRSLAFGAWFVRASLIRTCWSHPHCHSLSLQGIRVGTPRSLWLLSWLERVFGNRRDNFSPCFYPLRIAFLSRSPSQAMSTRSRVIRFHCSFNCLMAWDTSYLCMCRPASRISAPRKEFRFLSVWGCFCF